jgi:hypothetical protein
MGVSILCQIEPNRENSASGGVESRTLQVDGQTDRETRCVLAADAGLLDAIAPRVSHLQPAVRPSAIGRHDEEH